MNYPQIKPTLNLDFSNTKTLDPRINFRRGTPGAYYDGKTYAKAEENLIAYSEDFSNAYWRVNQITITAGHSSPDGGSTARKLAPTSGTGNKFIEIESGASQNDFPDLENLHFATSVFAKAGEKKYIKFSAVDTNLVRENDVIFDLSDGSIVESINNDETQYSIRSAGGDWYRIGITGFGMQQLRVFVLGDDLSMNAAGDGTSGIYLWGAQLEKRDSVTAYTPTNGTPVTKYQPQLMFASPDQPRFDHDLITGESKGLLIEESRTNLIEYSEDFDSNIDIDFYSSTYNGYSAISPDGTFTASEIIWDDLSVAGLAFGDRPAVSPGESYTLSMYIKAGSLSKIYLYHNIRGTNEAENSGSSGIKYDLINGVVDEAVDPDGKFNLTYNAVHVGNGWHRLSVTTIMPSDAGYLGWGMYNYESNVQAGNNTAYFWGAQLEQGSFPTSYIKTSGASATRSADNASITGENFSSWYRQDEGSLYSEISSFDNRDSQARITLSDGTDNNRIFMAANIGSNILKVDGWGSSNIGDYDLNINDFEVNKIYKKSFGLKRNDYFISIDGQSEGGIASQDTPLPLVDRFDFSTRSTAHYVNGHIKKLSYYPRRLTNEQLQQLTK